ncbi:putative serine/threonine-protein kinase PBL28, partial [Mucuna pruriens]
MKTENEDAVSISLSKHPTTTSQPKDKQASHHAIWFGLGMEQASKKQVSRSFRPLPAEFWQLEDQIPQPTKRRHRSSVFTLKEMEEATCSFSDGNLLGKGGFGRVYRGTLKSGEVVAIKKMELPAIKAAEGEREFRVEVDILSRLDHPNLVSLIGYCADGKHRFLVYEYMHNGNLQDHLNGIGERKMDWPQRLKVALGAAKGLAYLHSSSCLGIPIVHRDFKSTNILLDANFEAKISDFGLAKLMPEGQETHVTARVLGTFGYFDPEYTSFHSTVPMQTKVPNMIHPLTYAFWSSGWHDMASESVKDEMAYSSIH